MARDNQSIAAKWLNIISENQRRLAYRYFSSNDLTACWPYVRVRCGGGNQHLFTGSDAHASGRGVSVSAADIGDAALPCLSGSPRIQYCAGAGRRDNAYCLRPRCLEGSGLLTAAFAGIL